MRNTAVSLMMRFYNSIDKMKLELKAVEAGI